MNTNDFHFFVRVAKLGSISLAAKEADISVSVASQWVQRLEQNLKIRLFYRTTRRLSLTDEATVLLEQGLPLINQFQSITEHLSASKHALSGTLNVAASATFGTQVLTSVIAEFLKLHPDLKLILNLDDQNVDIIAQGIDVAIRIGHLQDSNLVASTIMPNPRLLCASPEYLEKFGRPKQLNELTQHQCIIQSHKQGLTHTWNFWDQNQQFHHIKVNGQFICNSGEAIRQAALASLGISNHSLWHVQHDLKNGHLEQVLPNFEVDASQIYALTPNRKLVPPKVQTFIVFLKEHFKRHSILNDQLFRL